MTTSPPKPASCAITVPSRQYFHKLIGGNFRLDGLQAAFLNVKPPHLVSYTARRRHNAAYYNSALQGLDITLPAEQPNYFHIWNQYTVRVSGNRRDALRQFLTERNIASAIYYPVPLHKQQCFTNVTAGTSLPVSEQLARECLSLPIYPELTPDQLKLVVNTFSAFAINPLLRVKASVPQNA